MRTITLEAFGASVTLDCPADVEAALRLISGPIRLVDARRAARRRQPVLRIDPLSGGQSAISDDPAMAAQHVLSEAEHELAAHSPRFAVVHAGVVTVRGQAVVVPGRSHAGKTSATMSLLRAGASYYSDEYALLSSDGLVSPYPRSLGVRHDDLVVPTSAETFGAPIGEGAVQVRCVVLTQYMPGEQFAPRRLSPGEGVLKLLNHCLQAQTAPERALTALEAVSRTATFWEGVRGEADDFARTVLDLIE